jgi:hypothetical protein
MPALCVYFGTEPPEQHVPAARDDLDVVLEPYHPLVKTGGFTEAFPHARRFVYVNPTTVDPWVLRQLADPPPLLGHDERWNLPRLDLEHPDGFAWAVRSACAALAGDDGRLHGAFVDDLDRLLPEQEEIAVEYVAQVTHQLGWEPAWFVNRGFALWGRIERLEAVLLEDISPAVSSREPVATVRWLREDVLPRVREVRARGVRVHALSYADQEPGPGGTDADPAADLRLHDQVRDVVDSVTTGADRNLHVWRTSP